MVLGVVMLGASVLPTTAAQAQASGPSSAAPAPAPARASLTAAQFEARLLALTNARRKKVGCPALKASTALTKAARAHTKKMVKAGNLSHQLPGEAGLAKRINAAGYKKWTALAENLAWGPETPAGVFSLWMNSTGHRQNIDRCVYREAGFGVTFTGKQPWVTLDLGRRR